MENLTAKFSAFDDMSDKISKIAEAGMDMAEPNGGSGSAF